MPYRPHIDGLRAIAVVAVILFHFQWHTLPGGFLGVDIFFVISGFLITQLLSEPSDLSWRARLGSFYLRRARRILPALLFTSLVAAAAAAMLYFPDGLTSIGKHLLLTPLMLANVASWLDGGYFTTTGNYFPLKHYWSLAVEEQFYLIYPFVFLLLPAAANLRRRMSVLTAISVASIALCICGEHWHPAITFYLMPARAWELMFGALAAAAPPFLFRNRLVEEGAGYASLAVVFSAFFLFDASTGFPNPWVLIPCAAVAWLLFIGRQTSTACQLLSTRPLVFTGKISYSLYLWHLPILAFAQYYAIRPLSLGELSAVWCVIYAAAVMSWLLIENPIRRKVVFSSARSLVMLVLAGSVLVSAVGAWFLLGKGLPWRFGRDIQNLTELDHQPRESLKCMGLPLTRVAAAELCRIGPESTGVRKVVLWGDSHALALLPAFEWLAQSNGVQVYFAGRTGCKPLLAVATKQEGCDAFNNAMAAAVRKIHPEVTILTAFWDRESAGIAEDSTVSASTPEEEWNWNATTSTLRAAGSAACVVLDVPNLPYAVPYALAMARRRGLDTSFIYVKRSDVLARYKDVEASVRALALSDNAVSVVDPKDALCPGERCEVESDGRSLYRDNNHLSKIGAMYVRDLLAQCLPKN